MKKRISLILTLIIVILCFSLLGCSLLQGKSAYEIACDNGFVGTEQEWLNSLKAQDAGSISIYDLFDAYLSQYPSATFAEFLQAYMIVEYSDIEYAVANSIQSVVSVYSTFARKNTRPGQSSDYQAGGAGVVYRIQDGYAYIITNYHVVYDRDSNSSNGIAKKIEVYSYGHENTEKTIQADFVGGSITKDIAVIKARIADFSSDIKAVQSAGNQLALGERVVAIGNPLGENISVSAGVISVDSEEIEMEALDSAAKTNLLRVIRTDTAINSGNSGGGLFNLKGELVGIVNAKTVESGVESMGYAIPVSVAAGVADCVIDNDSKKCILGVTLTTSSTQTQYNALLNRVDILETISVETIETNALAYGKLLKGDVIKSVSINGSEAFKITRLFHLSDFLYKVRTGDTIYLQIERNGASMVVELTPSTLNFQLI